MTSSNRKRLGEFLILLIYLIIEGWGLWDLSWPWPHFWALLAGVSGFVALLFLDGEFSEKQIAAYTGIASVMCIAIYFIVPAKKPFEVVDSAKLWSRTFPHPSDPNPEIVAYAFHHGVLAAGGAKGTLLEGVDLVTHVAITNRSGMPRRITEYELEVSGSETGPWTSLCPVQFRFTTQLYFIGDPKKPYQWPADDLLDTKLTEHSLQPGDTLAGWTGWICPLTDAGECRPAFLRYTLVDSLGERSKYELSNAQTDAKPAHDWLASAYLRPLSAERDFSGEIFLRGNCPNGAGAPVTIPAEWPK